MPTSATSLYVLIVLVWGSTWLAITYQLGTVEPLVSVIYRFGSASLLLFIICLCRGISLALSPRQHLLMLLQGSLLFGCNYWLVYNAELHLASGLVAVLFSFMVFFNVLNSRLFLGTRINPRVVAGAVLGLAGMALVFYPEIKHVELGQGALLGIALALGSAFSASLGSIVATYNTATDDSLSVFTINAWGMAYGTAVMTIIALVSGMAFTIELTASYLISLAYLSVFGSVLTFVAYLRLLVLIGPDKAGYSTMLIPLVALIISTVFEGYQWTLLALVGLALIMLGNAQVMQKPVAKNAG